MLHFIHNLIREPCMYVSQRILALYCVAMIFFAGGVMSSRAEGRNLKAVSVSSKRLFDAQGEHYAKIQSKSMRKYMHAFRLYRDKKYGIAKRLFLDSGIHPLLREYANHYHAMSLYYLGDCKKAIKAFQKNLWKDPKSIHMEENLSRQLQCHKKIKRLSVFVSGSFLSSQRRSVLTALRLKALHVSGQARQELKQNTKAMRLYEKILHMRNGGLAFESELRKNVKSIPSLVFAKNLRTGNFDLWMQFLLDAQHYVKIRRIVKFLKKKKKLNFLPFDGMRGWQV